MAEIATKTGENKGNVSSYLNGKKPIPDNFLKTLYEQFGQPGDGAASSIFTKKESPGEDYRGKYYKAMDTIIGYNEFLQEMLKTNSVLVLATVRTLSVRQESMGSVVLESLARIEKKPEKDLIREADMRIDRIEQEAHAHGSGAASHK